MENSEQDEQNRPRREARVTDFKRFHTTGHKAPQDVPGTTGDTGKEQNRTEGKVAAAVKKIETPGKEDSQAVRTTPSTPRARRALSGDTNQLEHPQPISHSDPVKEQPEYQDYLEHQKEPTAEHEPSMSTTASTSEIDRLRAELEKQKQINEQVKQELEAAQLRQQLEAERMKQKEWEHARSQIEASQQEAKARHEQILKEMSEAKKASTDKNEALQHLKARIAELEGTKETKEEGVDPPPHQAVADKLQELMKKKEEIIQAAQGATRGHEDNPVIQDLLRKLEAQKAPEAAQKDDQAKLMEHLIQTIQGKTVEDRVHQQKEVLKQFLVDANKVPTTGGATTLKPELLKKLTGESDIFNMGEWLAKLNKQGLEESKCDTCTEDCKHHKKSGMLDKATTNIQHKETWPQKNLLEDWADEDMDFKNMQFEHLIAGEMRTIETSTNPAEILGRLKLVRRMAYAKLRGYEWTQIRKMYAAILRSIEARDNTWECNFDRFEAILYRRPPQPRERNQGTTGQNSNKKWFCRDWNKGNCSKASPHKSWFGTGTNAIQRTVVHMCATCYMKDKQQKDHPEQHESCPHKEA